MSQDNPFANLSPPIHQRVEGLMSLGKLTDEVEFCGHRFGIRTLYGNEELLAGLLAKDHEGALTQPKAWVWAHLALAITHIDGKEDFCPPIGPDEEAHARARFNYLTKRWFWPTAEFIFQRWNDLQRQQAEAIQAVRDLSTRSLRPSSPSQSSLNEPGDSPNRTPSDDPS